MVQNQFVVHRAIDEKHHGIVVSTFEIPNEWQAQSQVNWNEYREVFPDEDQATANLPILYREFAESDHLKNLGY